MTIAISITVSISFIDTCALLLKSTKASRFMLVRLTVCACIYVMTEGCSISTVAFVLVVLDATLVARGAFGVLAVLCCNKGAVL